MMISKHRVFVFAEGKSHDLPFYDGLLSAFYAGTKISYSLRRIDSLDQTGQHGGKGALLDFYKWLLARNKLNQENNATRVSALFCMDKDFDDILYGSSASKHKIRTVHYNVEAEILINATLPAALAPAVSITRTEANLVARDLDGWALDLARAWHDWLVMCVESVAVRSSCGIGPKRESQVQHGSYGPTDANAVARMRPQIIQNAHVSNPAQALASIAPRLRQPVPDAKLIGMVNGKHLATYLEQRIRDHPNLSKANNHGLGNSLVRVMLSNLNFSAAWSRPYHAAFTNFSP